MTIYTPSSVVSALKQNPRYFVGHMLTRAGATLAPQERLLYQEASYPGKPDHLDDTLTNVVVRYLAHHHGEGHKYDIRCATLAVTNKKISEKPYCMIIFGETSVNPQTIDHEALSSTLRQHLTNMHYEQLLGEYTTDDIEILVNLNGQNKKLNGLENAGDSNGTNAVAYAHNGIGDPYWRYMPPEFALAHMLVQGIHDARLSQSNQILYPDGKLQVMIKERNLLPYALLGVDVAQQHAPEQLEQARQTVLSIMREVLSVNCSFPYQEIYLRVNPAGKFEAGGAISDSGLTGQKTFTNIPGSHGVLIDDFAGEGFSKPDLLTHIIATYMARHIVHAGLAQYANLGASVVMNGEGLEHMILDARGSAIVPPEKIVQAFTHIFNPTFAHLKNSLFDPNSIDALDLLVKKGWYDPEQPWMQTDDRLAAELRKAVLH